MMYGVILIILHKRLIMGKPQYDKKQRLKALKKLELNDFNYSKTAHECGVGVSTLKRWHIEHPSVDDSPEIARHKGIAEYTIAQRKISIVDKTSNLMEAAINRANTLMEKETDLNKIANMMRSITPLYELMIKAVDDKGLNNTSNQLRSVIENMSKYDIQDAEVLPPDNKVW